MSQHTTIKPSLSDLIKEVEQDLSSHDVSADIAELGTVVKIGDGIAQIYGLQNVASGEMLEFEGGVMGVAFNLDADMVGAIVMGEYLKIKEGSSVKATKRILEVPVGKELIGRVVNGIGEPVDAKGPLNNKSFYPVEKTARGVITRESVGTPLHTGIKAIDGMIPIGRGQRELIIGDRQTGKTQIAIDTILNQKEENVICIYVAIGQKEAKMARLVAELTKKGAMDYTVVVASSASASAALNYYAPYTGCAIAEYFMDQGKDVLIVYDDLSKHAVAYRQISLLLRRPPGREAYPGDVFFLHSRLLERAAKLNKNYGGGSITALPIIETQAGDISAYIPTNVISITDGQIYLEGDLFFQGIKPAVNVGLSVSRVGSAAQTKAMKKVAGKLRLDLAQFRELASFAQFGSDLDPVTLQKIERGKRMVEILKQGPLSPVHFSDQAIILFAATKGHLDEIKVAKVRDFEKKFLEFVNLSHKDLKKTIIDSRELSTETMEKLENLLTEFKEKNTPDEWKVEKKK